MSDIEAIKEDIAQLRGELAAAVDQLTERLNAKRIVHDKVANLRARVDMRVVAVAGGGLIALLVIRRVRR